MYGYPTEEDERSEEGDLIAKSAKVNKRNFYITIAVMVILFLVPFFFKSQESASGMLTWTKESLTIALPDGQTYEVPYDHIREVTLLEDFRPGTVITGEKTKTAAWGTRENEVLGTYVLCCSYVFDPVIALQTEEGTFVIGYESVDTTRNLCTYLQKLTV